MNKSLLGFALFAATASVVAFYPASDTRVPTANPPPTTHGGVSAGQALSSRPARIEVVFALDTTGSMSGLISAAKEKIWSIASTMAQAEPAPEIRMGLVAYRDRGDAYVTRTIDLSDDLDSMYAQLMDFNAGGGGDGPESVNQALHEAVTGMSWTEHDNVYRVVFLVGDAPPHMDYANEMQFPAIVELAVKRGIVINTIRCGQDETTRQTWQQIAALSQGDFFNVAQDGAAVAVATPFDANLARLSAAMDATRMVFGSAADKARHEAKIAATDKLHAGASSASLARRAAFNASTSGARNFLGDQDLVAAVSEGEVDLATIAPAALPAPLLMMAPAERAAVVQEKAEERASLKQQIAELARQRDAYIEAQVAAQGGRSDSLDVKLHDTVRRQAAAYGLSYEATPKF